MIRVRGMHDEDRLKITALLLRSDAWGAGVDLIYKGDVESQVLLLAGLQRCAHCMVM